MLGKIKELYDLQKNARAMQSKLSAVQAAGKSSNGVVTITLNGHFDLVSVAVADNTQLNKAMMEKSIREAFSDAQGKIKKSLVENFKDFMQ